MSLAPILPGEELAVLREALRGDGSAGLRVRHRRKDGSVFPAVVWSHDVAFGNRSARLVIVTDMSKHVQVEEQRRQSEERFRSVFEHAPNGLALADLEGRLTRVNPAFCAIVGRSEEELIGSRFRELTHPDDLAETDALVGRMLRGEADFYEQEKRYLRPDGAAVWVLLRASLVRDREGEPSYLIGHAVDVSERKAAERALQESEARLRLLADGANDFMLYRFRFHPARGFEYVSAGSTPVSGYTPEEHYADPDLFWRVVHPDDRHLLAMLEQVIATREWPLGGQPALARSIRKDGRVIWAQHRVVPVLDEAGGLVALEGIAQDVTERVLAEQALRASEERYRALLHAAAGGVIVVDAASLVISEANARAAELAGVDGPDDLVGSSVFEFFPEGSPPRCGSGWSVPFAARSCATSRRCSSPGTAAGSRSSSTSRSSRPGTTTLCCCCSSATSASRRRRSGSCTSRCSSSSD